MNKNIQKATNINGNMYQACIINVPDRYEQIKILLDTQGFGGVVKSIGNEIEIIGKFHPLHPYYTLGIKEFAGKSVPYSKPIGLDATFKYPPQIRGNFVLKNIPEGCISFSDALQYSYQFQEPIEIEIKEMKKMLGDLEDPLQDEVEAIDNLTKGCKWFINPEKFPEARPCKVFFNGGGLSLDYLLLKVEKFLPDGRFIISNKAQDNSFYVSIEIDRLNDAATFSFAIREGRNNKDKLSYLRYIQQLQKDAELHIILLENNEEIMSATLNSFDYRSSFNDINLEAETLEKIVTIEDKYDLTIEIPAQFYQYDLDAINYLFAGIIAGNYTGKWNSCSLNITLLPGGLDILSTIENGLGKISIVSPCDVIIFDKVFHIPKVKRDLGEVSITNILEIKLKRLEMNVGDEIALELIPNCHNIFIDTFNCDEVVIAESR
jgi:hypothetical protein